MIDEGYIKFECDWSEDAPPAEALITELNASRQLMVEHGLIGHDPQANVDFGNISIRAPQPGQLIITGTQTGHLPTLSAEHYACVTAFNIEANRVSCRGAIKASSETLSHAAIYALSGDIQAVIHVHHQTLWERLSGTIPTTASDIAYGTPDMAREFERLYNGSELPMKKIVAMSGHPCGLISFGSNLAEAEQRLLFYLADVQGSTRGSR